MNIVEKNNQSIEFEQNPGREIEQKFMPLFPELLEAFREQSVPVEQLYLSHPDERFQLRLRETIKDGELSYSATIKDRGVVTANGLDRLEENTHIHPDIYGTFRNLDVPILRKLRAEPMEHIAIDFYEDGDIRLESENPQALARFFEQTGLENNMIEMTGDRLADNQFKAHLEYRRQNGGREANKPTAELATDTVVANILSDRLEKGRSIGQIGGRSGSGKSTITREVHARLESLGIPTVVLSTDDYNIGANAARELFGDAPINWDHPSIYDTKKLAADIAALLRGEPIVSQTFNFELQEAVRGETIQPSSVYLIEGLYATSPDLAHLSGLEYTVPTSVAECTGRRLYRDHYSGERAVSAFKTAADTLRYIVEIAEPTYQQYQS